MPTNATGKGIPGCSKSVHCTHWTDYSGTSTFSVQKQSIQTEPWEHWWCAVCHWWCHPFLSDIFTLLCLTLKPMTNNHCWQDDWVNVKGKLISSAGKVLALICFVFLIVCMCVCLFGNSSIGANSSMWVHVTVFVLLLKPQISECPECHMTS